LSFFKKTTRIKTQPLFILIVFVSRDNNQILPNVLYTGIKLENSFGYHVNEPTSTSSNQSTLLKVDPIKSIKLPKTQLSHKSKKEKKRIFLTVTCLAIN
jgi:hypothetical protein